jgi:P27 family predicted phage terminase small subunit
VSRRPTPTAIKKLNGNPGNRALHEDQEPKPESGVPEMPKGLRKTAKREWKRLAPKLDEVGVITKVDGKAFAMYCDAYADWEVAQKKCMEDGMWYSEPVLNHEGLVVGYKHKQAPWFNVKVTAMKVMKSFLIEFGLTPASRSKLKIERKDTEDDSAKLSRHAPQPKVQEDEDGLDAALKAAETIQ